MKNIINLASPMVIFRDNIFDRNSTFIPIFLSDIGLIKVPKIEFNKKVQPIKYTSNFVGNGTVLQATGWGQLSVSDSHAILFTIFVFF